MVGTAQAGRCVKKGLNGTSAEAGEGEPVSPSGHTSCCHLPSQAPRYPGGVRRHLCRLLNPVSASAASIKLQSPGRAPLASSHLPSSPGYLWPLYYYRGRGGDAGLFRHMLYSRTMGNRMFSPSDPLIVSPFSLSASQPGSPAQPQRSMNNQASTDNQLCVSPPPMLIRIPALMKVIIQSLYKH